MAAESSRSNSTADSYIGSLISLTSKSEIRYEGILYNINTEESSIGLRNVRSFGTEGRKKDGQQVMPSDKVYEYILFRGSDIKDLQVKSSPPVQTTQPINSDPAIIQSHYPHPASTTSSLPLASSRPLTELSPHPGSSFQGGVPLYQPGSNLGSWGPTPPSVNGSGLPMPMYWPGFYGPPSGVPQFQQQTLLRPPPGLPMPHPSMQQPMQYPGFNTSLPSGPSNLPDYSSHNLTPVSLPASTLPSSMPLETVPVLFSNQGSSSTTHTSLPSVSLPSASLLTGPNPELNANIPLVSNKPNMMSPYQAISQPIASSIGTFVSAQTETTTPPLITPGQLLQSGQAALSSSQLSQTIHRDLEVVQVYPSPSPASASASVPAPVPVSAPAPAPLSEPPAPIPTSAQPPILPLPTPLRHAQKMNGAAFHDHHSYRGRGRGRGRGPVSSRPVMKFTEEFDFTAMNEKFNKDEVWGHLGKGSKDKEGVGNSSDEYDYEDGDYTELPKLDVKPVYSKDDFFDTLSSNTLDNQSNTARPRFSEQMKMDTETFGEFSRYRGGRGGRGYGRGGRFRGGYYGRGYGYNGRGRGRNMPARDF